MLHVEWVEATICFFLKNCCIWFGIHMREYGKRHKRTTTITKTTQNVKHTCTTILFFINWNIMYIFWILLERKKIRAHSVCVSVFLHLVICTNDYSEYEYRVNAHTDTPFEPFWKRWRRWWRLQRRRIIHINYNILRICDHV